MRYSLFCAVVLACVAMSATQVEIVCLPNYCDTVRCQNDITEASCKEQGQEFRPKGGFCGCCPSCVTVIKTGGVCVTLMGVPPTAVCEEGSVCLDNVCVRVRPQPLKPPRNYY